MKRLTARETQSGPDGPGRGLVPAVAEHLEGSHAFLIAAYHLAIDQAGPDLEMVHRLSHERVAGPRSWPPRVNAHGIAPAMSRKPSCLIS
jgi:hypothetical protein